MSLGKQLSRLHRNTNSCGFTWVIGLNYNVFAVCTIGNGTLTYSAITYEMWVFLREFESFKNSRIPQSRLVKTSPEIVVQS
jgi:hypothetical protein